jgi:hypothetical protein
VTEAVKLAIDRELEGGQQARDEHGECGSKGPPPPTDEVGGELAFEERGVQSIKGKGEMRTFFVGPGNVRPCS